MRHVTKLALAASVSAVALGSVGHAPAYAADMGVPEYGYQQQPQPYYPPPQAQAYAPPPAAYIPPPPPPQVFYYAYAPSPVVAAPYPYYYAHAPYWHGYAPRVAYGYGHWGHGYRRW